MTEKTVHTIAGPFDRKRTEALKETLDKAKADGMSRDDVTMFEGQEMLISFGEYLFEYVDQQFANRNHGDL